MAIVEPACPPPLQPISPRSVQPGGGLCLSVELAWGRVRRGWLRRFRPAYVRRMLQKRQGHCPDCPHDIIDPRDLKFCRNVCGYWFRNEDDRFAWRGQLGLARAGLTEVVCFSLVFLSITCAAALAASVVHWGFWIAVAVVLVLWFQVVVFFRDPDRAIAEDPSLLLSPADGRVTHIGEVEATDFPGGRAFRISIFLSVFNVHVNRAPRAGRVVDVRYFPGSFLDARHAECPVRNEQLWIDLEEISTARRLRVKQISGAVARRIVCWLKAGDDVRAGERFGMIKFGSRTEVLVPAGEAMDLRVRVGDHVRGGATVLLRFSPQRHKEHKENTESINA
jgi:phosphatidylserine decarboxylase